MRGAGVAILATAALAAPIAARADEYTIPMEVRQLTAVTKPRHDNHGLARWIYAQLVPRGYAMPKHPLVEMHIVDVSVPQVTPGVPYNDYSRWLEGDVSIRVRHGRHPGWYALGWPVMSDFEFDLGRAAGLPKYSATMSMKPAGGGWDALARVRGRVTEALRWRPVAQRGAALVRRAATRAGRSGDPFLALNPALKGPDLYRVRFRPTPRAPATSLPAADRGMVRYRLAPDQNRYDADSKDPLPNLFAPGWSMADLVRTRGRAPGVHWHAIEDLRLESGRIGGGGGYSHRAGAGRSHPRGRR